MTVFTFVLNPTHMKILSLVGLAAVTISLTAQPSREWATLLGGNARDHAQQAVFTPDGEIYVVGNTTTTGPIAGVTPTKIGNDYSPGNSGAFIARFSANGQLISITTFGQGTVNLTGVAVADDAVFVTGHATDTFAPFIDADAYDRALSIPVWSIPHNIFQNLSYKCVLIRLPRDLSVVEKATWLGEVRADEPTWGKGVFFYNTSNVWSLLRDKPRVKFFQNGDLCVLADGGLVYSAGRDYLYRFSPDDFSQPIWVSEINSVGNNATALTNDHGDMRSHDLEISPTDESIYVVGYASGDTGHEPYKDPYAFKFSPVDGTQLWSRPTSGTAGPYGMWDMKQTAVNPGYISDSTGRAAAVSDSGDPFFAAFTDGGASILVRTDPWTLSGGIDRIDGDGFWGFGGADSATVVGLAPQSGGDWIRAHGLRPHTGGSAKNRVQGLAEWTGTHVYAVGWGPSVPNVNAWPGNTSGNSLIMKLDLAFSGTTREFVSHIPGLNEFEEITTDGKGRYVAVGFATSTPGYLENAVQSTHAGDYDGYILVFRDPLPGPQGLPVRIMGVAVMNDQLHITFESAEAGTYSLESSTDGGNPWTKDSATPVIASGSGEVHTLVSTISSLRGFRRIVVD